MILRIAKFLRTRPLAIICSIIGAAIFVTFFVRQDTINNNINKIQRQYKVQARTPCIGLTVRQCAKLLLAQLTPQERKRLEGIATKRIRELIRKEQKRLGIVPQNGPKTSSPGTPRGPTHIPSSGGGGSPSPSPTPPFSLPPAPGGGGSGGPTIVIPGLSPVHTPTLPIPIPCIQTVITQC